ncbi:glycosyltransferase family 1 protein, partial [Pseudomonas syringae pv. tagetis]
GCVLLAFDQGDEENRALGFVDMLKIVLYRDIPELREKLSKLRENTLLATEISRNGETLFEERFTFHALWKAIVDAM